MNKTYRNVWNAATNTWVAASETAKGRTKGSARAARSALVALALAGAGMSGAFAAEACTTADGKNGSLGTAGVCTANTTGSGGSIGTMGSIGTNAVLDDAYIKVNGGAAAANASGANAIAIGTGATSTGSSSTALGTNASASGTWSLALGAGASNATSIDYQTALGSIAKTGGEGATAVGYNANASAANSVALGSNSVANVANTVSVGNATTKRKIVNMAAGDLSAASTDAVNGAQLYATNQNVAKNTSDITTLNTSVTNIDSRVTTAEGNITKNTGDITTINTKISDLESGGIGLVQQSAAGANLTVGKDTDGTAVSFANNTGAARTLTGVAAGVNDADAVNMAQLKATNADVAKNTADIATNTTNVTNLTTRMGTAEGNISDLQTKIGDGSIGLVQQDAASRTINVAGGTDGAVVSFANSTGAARTLTGVAAGVNDADAVNMAQLKATNTDVAKNTTDIGGLTTRMGTAEGNISDLQTKIGDGSIGLVQQDATTRNITVAAGTDGTVVDFKGTAGDRTLTGVKDGVANNDAANVGQLNATASTINTRIDGVDTRITGIDARVTNNESSITNLETKIGSGTVGLVQQATSTSDITVAAGTGGSAVNFAGTAGDRVLSGVASGINNNDAVSVGQLKSVIGYNIVDPLDPLMAVRYDGTDMKSVTFGTDPLGTVLNGVANGSIAFGSKQAVNGGQLYDMQQKYDKQFSDLDSRVGNIESGSVGGPGPGPGTPADSAGTGENSTVVGKGADASGKDSTAIGNGAKASHENSVAIGAGSTTSRDNEVSFGSPGNERILGNVADGVRDTDAVNVRQLNNAVGGLNNKIDSTRSDAMGGVAAAMAVAGLPVSAAPGKTFMAIAGSTYGGEQGTAIGASYMSKDGKWLVKGAVNTSTRGEVGAVVGGGFYW